jgi:hypothetical protein
MEFSGWARGEVYQHGNRMTPNEMRPSLRGPFALEDINIRTTHRTGTSRRQRTVRGVGVGESHERMDGAVAVATTESIASPEMARQGILQGIGPRIEQGRCPSLLGCNPEEECGVAYRVDWGAQIVVRLLAVRDCHMRQLYGHIAPATLRRKRPSVEGSEGGLCQSAAWSLSWRPLSWVAATNPRANKSRLAILMPRQYPARPHRMWTPCRRTP